MSASMYKHDDYTIGWICPLEVEHIAATEMLDEEHPSLLQQPADHNVYTLGSIHGHLVVIAGLPYPSNSAAAAVATQLRNTFPNMRSVLLVGIGGGVPTKTSSGILRLGDVVVSRPTGTHSGAVQYDYGKLRVGEFSRTGSLPPPPTVLLNADRHVAVRQARAQHDYLALEVERINTNIRGLRQFRHPGVGKDRLYRADYVHRQDGIPCDIAGCDKAYTISRDTDEYSDGDEGSFQSVVHRGTIACGELVIRNGVERDRLAKSENVLCFETEAAGALLGFPCLVIRGISDYADSHKNDEWHGYAAGVSAAYARLLLAHVPVELMRESQWAPKDPSKDYQNALQQRLKGTGHWFLNSEAFLHWKFGAGGLESRRKFLWINGLAGSGKTILASSIIESLSESSFSGRTVIYYFFDLTHEKKRAFDTMMRSLTLQLCLQTEQMITKMDELLEYTTTAEIPDTDIVMRDFFRALRFRNSVHMVIDALDECLDREHLLLFLEKLVASEAPDIELRILVTSRPEGDINSSLRAWIAEKEVIRMSKYVINHDIETYIRHRIATDRGLKRWHARPKTLALIESEVRSKSDGMFRWAACHLDNIRLCIDLRSLRETLSSLPETLEDMYGRILENMLDVYKRQAITLLQFLIFSNLPLCLEDAVEIVAIDLTQTPSFDPALRMPDEEDLLIICSGLVSVAPREANEMTKGFWAGKYIRLAHASVKDYLLSDRVHETFKPEFEKFHGETCIVNHSLHYLTHVNEDFSKQKQDRPNSIERRSTYDQLQEEFTEKLRIELVKVGQMMRFEEELEAASIMIDEVSEDEDKDIWLKIEEEDQVHDIAKRSTNGSTPDEFKTSQRRSETPRSTWQTISRRITKKYPLARYASNVWTLYAKAVEEASSLLMTEFFNQKGIVLFNWYGLCYLSDRWERHGISKLNLPRSGPPPLYCAALLGLERCVRLMLEQGLDAQVYMWPYGTPLQAAAAEGHIEIVKMLLDAGAVDKNDVSTGKTALQAACIKRHDDIIKLLVSSGARVE